MRETVYEDDFLIAKNKRIILKLIKVEKDENFPEGLEFAVQYLYFKNNEWIRIARIDNQLHEGKPGVHIHILKREKVEWTEMSFNDAKDEIIKIGNRIIKNIVDKI